MNEKLDLVELLKGCEGEEIYCTIYGEVKVGHVFKEAIYSICVITPAGDAPIFTRFGELHESVGECILFPSKDQRDWNKWKAEREAKMEHQFKPFDKVLVRDYEGVEWECSFYSHKVERDSYVYKCLGSSWNYCIPYEGNEHLAGTTDEPNK
ncbi:MAG: hypothetical protein ACRCZB_02965 [Bacteroidales bacterium]